MTVSRPLFRAAFAAGLLLLLAPACSISLLSTREAARKYSRGAVVVEAPREEFVYFLQPVRGAAFVSAPTAAENHLLERHFDYLEGLLDDGTLLLAGPSTDPPYTGIVVFRARDGDEARRVMEADPAVAGGVFEARLSPFRVSLLGDAER